MSDIKQLNKDHMLQGFLLAYIEENRGIGIQPEDVTLEIFQAVRLVERQALPAS